MVELERRLRQALCGPLQANTLRSNPGSQWLQTDKVLCSHCHKRFSSEWARQQHLDAKSGQDDHPVMAAAESWERMWQPMEPSAHVAAAAAATPQTEILRSPTRGPDLDHPERDLCLVCHEGMTYFCNYQTQSSYWSKEDGESATREFYTGLRKTTAQDGRTFWVRGPLGGWKVNELYIQFKAQTAATQNANRAPSASS